MPNRKYEVHLPAELPPEPTFEPNIRRAPDRGLDLSKKDIALALKNALRYIPKELHSVLAPEFLQELKTRGRIYGYRYRPQGHIYGKPIDEYKGITPARAIQVMIDNNLDFDVALYPYELVTYGESGQVCQNWMQYRLIKQYLEIMTENQTLVVASGHPLGLFPSRPEAPRVISTNGLMVGKWDNPIEFKRLTALGVANYGQMTAGGWMYIGPQGIVNGTYITLLNAGRKYLGIPEDQNLAGVLYVSSGLGGMSGAQSKAIEIAGGIGIIAEVDKNRARLLKSYSHVEKFKSDYRIPESMITRMKEMAKGEKMEWDDEQFRKSEQFLKIQLKALMARDLFDSSAYFVIINDENDLFREGLRIISNPGVYDELLNGSFSVARK